jgi:hypothetical protein
MLLFVKTLTGQSWQLEVNENTTGYDVKRAVEKSGGIPAYSALLIFAGITVDNNDLISEVNPNYDIMVIRRPVGFKKLTCRMCRKTTENGCSGCSVSYCGRECQAKDWSKHRVECKPHK